MARISFITTKKRPKNQIWTQTSLDLQTGRICPAVLNLIASTIGSDRLTDLACSFELSVGFGLMDAGGSSYVVVAGRVDEGDNDDDQR